MRFTKSTTTLLLIATLYCITVVRSSSFYHSLTTTRIAVSGNPAPFVFLGADTSEIIPMGQKLQAIWDRLKPQVDQMHRDGLPSTTQEICNHLAKQENLNYNTVKNWYQKNYPWSSPQSANPSLPASQHLSPLGMRHPDPSQNPAPLRSNEPHQIQSIPAQRQAQFPPRTSSLQHAATFSPSTMQSQYSLPQAIHGQAGGETWAPLQENLDNVVETYCNNPPTDHPQKRRRRDAGHYGGTRAFYPNQVTLPDIPEAANTAQSIMEITPINMPLSDQSVNNSVRASVSSSLRDSGYASITSVSAVSAILNQADLHLRNSLNDLSLANEPIVETRSIIYTADMVMVRTSITHCHFLPQNQAEDGIGLQEPAS